MTSLSLSPVRPQTARLLCHQTRHQRSDEGAAGGAQQPERPGHLWRQGEPPHGENKHTHNRERRVRHPESSPEGAQGGPPVHRTQNPDLSVQGRGKESSGERSLPALPLYPYKCLCAHWYTQILCVCACMSVCTTCHAGVVHSCMHACAGVCATQAPHTCTHPHLRSHMCPRVMHVHADDM